MKFQKKITIALLMIGLTPLILIGFYGYISGQNAIINSEINKISALNSIKKKGVLDFIENVKKDLAITPGFWKDGT